MGGADLFPRCPLGDDPMAALTERYADLTCPRSFREAVVGEFKKDHAAELQTRYAHLGKYIEKWGVEDAVIELVRFCDPFGYEVPELIKNRAQTFLENLL